MTINKNIENRTIEAKDVENFGYSLTSPKKGEFSLVVTIAGQEFPLNQEQAGNVLDYGLRRVAQDRTTKLRGQERHDGVVSEFARMARGFWSERDENAANKPTAKGGKVKSGVSFDSVEAYLVTTQSEHAESAALLDEDKVSLLREVGKMPEWLTDAYKAVEDQNEAKAIQESEKRAAEAEALLASLV